MVKTSLEELQQSRMKVARNYHLEDLVEMALSSKTAEDWERLA